MIDPEVYLMKMSAFSRMLRIEGLSVGTAETADACRILTVLGMDDRARVKTALRTVYAKSREEQATFDRVFDGFFIPEAAMRRQAEEFMRQQQALEQGRREAERDLQLNGKAMELSESQRETYAAMPASAREGLRAFLERYRESAERSPDLYNNFIHSVFAKTLMEQQLMMEDAALGCEDIDPELGLMFRDISSFQDAEIPRAIDFVRRLSQQINAELSAKRRRGSHSGALDFRRTIRKGLETGGSFYRLSHRKRRTRRRCLTLVCDVSGSMLQFSEFVLRFMQALGSVSDSSRCFLFSEEMVEADPFSLQNMDLFRGYVRDSGVYGKGTNLGAALEKLCALRPSALSAATTLVILSDTKTVDQPRALRALAEAKRMCGQLLFLNPLPENRWPHLKSAQAVSSVCPMLSCNTLSALSRACRGLIG